MIVSMLIYAFVSSFTPGPNNIMAMVFTNKYGVKQTFRFCLGVGIGFLVILCLSCFFNLILYQVMPKMVMAFIGAAYMIYLAVKIMKSKGGDDETLDRYNHFIPGMMLQFINPKAILYGLTVISTFVLPYGQSNMQYVIWTLILALIGFLGTFSWSLFGSLYKRFLTAYEKPFQYVMGLLLIYSAISMIWGYVM
ncbi:LysE family transporter [Bacillus safensis]|uniref:LysE family transporter n=1 Tax=Bacillus safensis TaxID=561879 RepID=UPI001BE65F98|nr:LysE family transporter [Bacillus safensis]MBT2263176.1 LysE family transporter [Bacillus safensis]